jgi:hypothetical protein
MAAWKQWAVKAGVAAGVAVVLSLALPTLLFYTSSSPEIHGALSTSFTLAEIGCVVVLATVVSLYVSSLCTSGLRALIVSLPVVLGIAYSGPS